MFGTVHATSPVSVRVDREPSEGILGGLASTAGRALVWLAVTVWRAPLLALLAVVVGLAGWLGLTARWVDLAALLGVVVLVGAFVWRVRPALLVWLRCAAVGQLLRVAVYRRRWATACLASGAVARVGSTVHVPVLVRHTHTPTGRDVLLVRMAPGQTLTTWRDAAGSLASSFSAHSVTAHAGSRPGWVVLDVLRRDPLAGEHTAPDPAARRPLELGGASAVAPSGPVVIGRDEHGQDVTVDPYATPHVGLQGATRSGKSSTCYTLLAALAHRPDVVVTGVDPSGLLLDAFGSDHGGRGGALVATGTHREDLTRAAGVLADLVHLMDTRIRELRASGRDKVTGYSAALPAVWVVLEEYPGLLAAAKALDAESGAKPGERLAPKIAAAVGRLVKEGAKVGVCVLVLAQRMSHEAMNTDDRSNLGLRVTMRVDNSDAVGMLHAGLSRDLVAAVADFAPGVALVEAPGDGARRVRMHYTSYELYRDRVAAGITATAAAPALRRDGTPAVDVVGQVVPMPAPAPTAGTSSTGSTDTTDTTDTTAGDVAA